MTSLLMLLTIILAASSFPVGIVKIGATKVAAYGFLTPIFVIIISISVGMGELELITLPGILLVIIAMFIIQREPKLKLSKGT